MCIRWAKVAKVSEFLGTTPSRRRLRVTGKNEEDLRRLHGVRLDHVGRARGGRPFGTEVDQLGFQALDVEAQRTAAREGQYDLAGGRVGRGEFDGEEVEHQRVVAACDVAVLEGI